MTPSRLSSRLGRADAKGLSASTVTRLKAVWEDEYTGRPKRSLAGNRYVHMWTDGIHCNVRFNDHEGHTKDEAENAIGRFEKTFYGKYESEVPDERAGCSANVLRFCGVELVSHSHYKPYRKHIRHDPSETSKIETLRQCQSQPDYDVQAGPKCVNEMEETSRTSYGKSNSSSESMSINSVRKPRNLHRSEKFKTKSAPEQISLNTRFDSNPFLDGPPSLLCRRGVRNRRTRHS